jgi:plastocyanin
MSIGHSPLRRGLLAATATLALGAVVAGVSVAGAATSFRVYSVENGATPCFSVVAGKTGCTAADRGDLTIQTGDTVVWDFSTANGNFHNAASKSSTPAEPAWNARNKDQVQQGGTMSWRFTTAGVYEYYCRVHASMVGTITVEGEAVPTETEPQPEPATETAVDQPTVSATATAAASATPDDHTSTPAPGHATSAKDTEAPRLASASAKKQRDGVRVRFWLSEPATVTINARRKGSRVVLTGATVQAPAGTRALMLRSKAFKKGTYTVELRPTDAMGNRAGAVTTTLRVK